MRSAAGATTTRRGIHLLDRLALLDPRTWWGCFRIINAFLPLDATLLVETVARVFIPAVLLLLLTVPSSTVTLIALLSPWSVGSMSRVAPHISKQLTVVHSWATSRSSPLPDALECLNDRIERQRAYRTRRYDMYYPPEKMRKEGENGIDEDGSCHALLILPGALIDHGAYSEIATRLADAGILVVVLSMEPLRMASPFLSRTKTKSLVRLTQQISKKHHQHSAHNIRTWSVAGHSFGGYRIAELIAASGFNKGVPLPFQNFVLWASPAVHHLLAMASPDEKQRLRVLSIQGERDPTRFMMGGEDNLSAVLETFPLSCEIILKGASHSQFGSYLVANRTDDPHHWSHSDIAMISRQEQLDQIGNLTVHFLNNK